MSELADRMVKYLKKVSLNLDEEKTWVEKRTLTLMAASNGYKQSEIREAVNLLEFDNKYQVNVGTILDGRTLSYRYYHFPKEEEKRRLEAFIWFDQLPTNKETNESISSNISS